jgi:hypothetical protein
VCVCFAKNRLTGSWRECRAFRARRGWSFRFQFVCLFVCVFCVCVCKQIGRKHCLDFRFDSIQFVFRCCCRPFFTARSATNRRAATSWFVCTICATLVELVDNSFVRPNQTRGGKQFSSMYFASFNTQHTCYTWLCTKGWSFGDVAAAVADLYVLALP